MNKEIKKQAERELRRLIKDPPLETVEDIRNAMEMITVLLGPDKWVNGTPITVTVKVPEEIIEMAATLKKKTEGNLPIAAFMESYISHMMFAGIEKMTERLPQTLTKLTKAIMRKHGISGEENKEGGH